METIKTIGMLLIVLLILSILPFLIFTRWEWSEDLVSGIVYNNTNNATLSGNTHFNIRAAVDTYVSEENVSSYCLPPGSPYQALINKAAADKTVKVVVTTQKGFWFKLPWTCISNVKVEEQK